MDKDLEERAADLATIAVFNACRDCHKASDACEPVKVDVANIKESISELSDAVKGIREDLKNVLIWSVITLLGIIGSVGYLALEAHFSKIAGG